jgi:RNA polymerase sigma-70 factor (ECF subfamily)
MTQTTPADAQNPMAVPSDYYGRVYCYILSLVHDSTEAEDLTQETFLRAYQRQDSLRDPQAFTAWLYRIATHICLDRLRQHGRRDRIESEVDPDEVDTVDWEVPSLQQVIEQNEMSACVQRYLARLSDSYRAVILLHDMHGLTASEISALLNVSLATVKIRLHRARQKLRIVLVTACTLEHDERGVFTCEAKSNSSS